MTDVPVEQEWRQSMKTTVDDVRFRIAAARRMLHHEGCDSNVAGHVSARADGETAFWITPFQYFDETIPDDVVKVDYECKVLEGDRVISPAVQFHAEIYRARADVGSVIHTHSHHATVLASTGQPLGMYNVLSVLFYNDVVYHRDDGTKPPVDGVELAAELGSDKHVVLIANHGAIITSNTLENATVEAMALEQVCHHQLDIQAHDGFEIPTAEVLRGREAYKVYWRQQMWQAHLRRLRRSDPDLFEYLAN
jgi:L-fuculose-phosphate aldolase